MLCKWLQVFNYGQSVFEGMKAQRSAKDRIVLFRPQQNAARMAEGAARLAMPAPPADLFVGAVQELVRDNQDFVPPQGKGSLYIRPLLMGTGGILGLGPAPSYTFTVFCAAVGAYFKVTLLPCLDDPPSCRGNTESFGRSHLTVKRNCGKFCSDA